MDYKELVALYEKLEKTSKRLEKTYYIAQMLKNTPQEDLEHFCLLIQGKIYPDYDEHKIGVAARLVLKSIVVASGLSLQKIEDDWRTTGDLGETAKNLIGKKQQATLASTTLTVEKVFANLRKLAEMTGAGTVDRKVQLIAELLSSASALEAKYIVRSVLEDLRVGVGEGAMRDSLVWAFFGEELHVLYDNDQHKEVVADEHRENYNSYVTKVQQFYDVAAHFGEVAIALKEKGIVAADEVKIMVGKPLKCMLYPKALDFEDAFERVGVPAAFEHKLDGFRMQVHKSEDKVKLFTRRLDDVSNQFPDVASVIKEYVKADNCILDAEVIGIDLENEKWLPFQNISQRIKRKHNIAETVKKIPVVIIIFDILSLNHENTIPLAFKKRRELLESVVTEKKNVIEHMPQIITGDLAVAEKFYKESLRMGNEGVMAKKLDAPYKPGSRVGYGVKIKPVMETLDLVIVGAEWGEGKRSAWLSSFTLACLDGDAFLPIGKVGTGIKELESEGVTFQQLTDLLKPLVLSEDGKEVKVKPQIIVEINYEEIQKSPTYASGFALRFPRVVRLREDKSLEEVDSIERVEKLFSTQRS